MRFPSAISLSCPSVPVLVDEGVSGDGLLDGVDSALLVQRPHHEELGRAGVDDDHKHFWLDLRTVAQKN